MAGFSKLMSKYNAKNFSKNKLLKRNNFWGRVLLLSGYHGLKEHL